MPLFDPPWRKLAAFARQGDRPAGLHLRAELAGGLAPLVRRAFRDDTRSLPPAVGPLVRLLTRVARAAGGEPSPALCQCIAEELADHVVANLSPADGPDPLAATGPRTAEVFETRREL